MGRGVAPRCQQEADESLQGWVAAGGQEVARTGQDVLKLGSAGPLGVSGQPSAPVAQLAAEVQGRGQPSAVGGSERCRDGCSPAGARLQSTELRWGLSRG